jgi:RNA polymerase sigma-70 factor (ECF subfamily)
MESAGPSDEARCADIGIRSEGPAISQEVRKGGNAGRPTGINWDEDIMTEGQRARVVGELVEQHWQPLYRFAYRLSGSAADAEDLVQQAFLTAQRKLEQLREDEKARSWLMTIIRNNFLKSRRHRDFTQFESFDGLAQPGTLNGRGAIDREELQAALNDMPEDFRIPVVLFYFQEMSYKQIAAHLDVPEGTVMSRISRGKAFLRQRLIMRMGDEAPTQLTADRSS